MADCLKRLDETCRTFAVEKLETPEDGVFLAWKGYRVTTQVKRSEKDRLVVYAATLQEAVEQTLAVREKE